MADVFNTSYRTKADVNTEEERLYYNIEEGAYVRVGKAISTIRYWFRNRLDTL